MKISLPYHGPLYLFIRPYHSLYTERPLTWPSIILHSAFLSARISCTGRYAILEHSKSPGNFQHLWTFFPFGEGRETRVTASQQTTSPPKQILEHQSDRFFGRLSYPGPVWFYFGPWATLIQQQSAPRYPSPLCRTCPPIDMLQNFLSTKAQLLRTSSGKLNPWGPQAKPPALTASITSCRYQMLPLIFGHQQVLQRVQHLQHLKQGGGVGGGENTTFIKAYIRLQSNPEEPTLTASITICR